MSPNRIVQLAALAIAALGMAASAAGQEDVDSPDLASLIRSLGSGGTASADELVRIGKPAVPGLLEVVQSGRPPARYRAMEVLGRMGPDASEVLPDLVEVAPNLGSTELPTLIRAVGNLLPYRESIPELEAKLIPMILKAYESASGQAREGVVMSADRTLARFKLKADAEIAELQTALENPDSYLRELAAELLGRRGSDAKPALKSLDEAAGNFEHPDVKGSNLNPVEYSSEVQRSAANAVLAIATDEELSIGRAYAIMLRVGSQTERVVSARELRKMAASIAADAILSSEVVFHLVQMVGDEQTSPLAREGVVALGEIGKSFESWTAARYWATTAIPLLQVLARSSDTQIAELARAALDR